MTPGLSLFYGGMVGKKNLISTMLQSFISLGVVTMLWVVVGFSLAFGDPIGITIDGTHYGLIGNPFQFMFFDQVGPLPNKVLGATIPFVLFALFQMKFAVITPAIITGSFAERVRFIGYLFFIGIFTINEIVGSRRCSFDLCRNEFFKKLATINFTHCRSFIL